MIQEVAFKIRQARSPPVPPRPGPGRATFAAILHDATCPAGSCHDATRADRRRDRVARLPGARRGRSRAADRAAGVGGRRERAAIRHLESADLEAAWRRRRAGAAGRPGAADARRRAGQDAAYRQPPLRSADRAGRRPQRHHRRGRRRGGGRRGGLRRRDLPAGRAAGARAHDVAGAGRQRHRRQGRRQPRARQEPDRRVPSADRGGRRPGRARDAAPPRVPCRALRGRQVRRHREPRPVRPRGPRPHRDLPAPAGGAGARDRRVVPHQGRGRGGGRTRGRAATHPQLRPHRRPRDRGGERIPALPARRGGRLRHARRGRHRRGARGAVQGRLLGPRRSHHQARPPAAGERPERVGDRRSHPPGQEGDRGDGCTWCCRRGWARR